MRRSKWMRLLTAVFLFAAAAPLGAASAGTRIDFSSLDTSHADKVSGTLYVPEKTPCPAIILIHGTMGIDDRGELYRGPLLNAGIAIFEVDFKTGIYRGALDRPHMDRLLPMAFAALKELRKQPAVDPNRIGVMGFSMGGHIALRSSMESSRKQWLGDEKGFVAVAAFYPVCKLFIPALESSGSTLTGAPMIIFYGTEDSYEEGSYVPELKRLLADKYHFNLITVEYPGATHDFNHNGPSKRAFDPVAKHKIVHMKWDPDAAHDSVTKVVAFLQENLAAK